MRVGTKSHSYIYFLTPFHRSAQIQIVVGESIICLSLAISAIMLQLPLALESILWITALFCISLLLPAPFLIMPCDKYEDYEICIVST